MFTGLVEDIGTVERVEASTDSRVLHVRPAALPVDELAIGESVAIEGVCLTVTARGDGRFTVLAGEETLRRTTVGDIAAGARVNLERALRLGDRLGGHLMQGHVDGVGTLAGRLEGDSNLVLEVRAEAPILRYVAEKGSIAVDGISLTVVSVGDYSFAVALIPHTVAVTTLAGKPVGARVNLEVDMIAKYVERLLGTSPGIAMSTHPIERVRAAVDDIRRGRMVILVDDEDRENEGDLVMAAEKVTPEAVSFMAIHGRGLICLTLTGEQIDQLKLPMMVRDNQAPLGTAFTVSIEARSGVTTGISARDRAVTILTAIADDAKPDDVVSPGHVFPLRARPGGVLVRTGQTEGSVDLARLAGLKPAGVVCEIMRDDGEMARMPDLERFSAQHRIPILSVADLVSYRLQHEHIVERRASGQLRPGFLGPGEPFAAHLYGTDVEATEYVALVRGDIARAAAVGRSALVRVQSMCPIGDPLRTRPELSMALEAIDRSEAGVFLYVFNKARTSLARAFERQVLDRSQQSGLHHLATGSAQTEALRDFGLGAQVLADLGCRKIRLLSNTDRRIVGIEGFGIEVVERVPIDEVSEAQEGRLVPLPGKRFGRGSRGDEGA